MAARNEICKPDPTPWLICLVIGLYSSLNLNLWAAGDDFVANAAPLLENFCFECHGNEVTEARINLERVAADPSFATRFKVWQKVVGMLQQGKMPPEDMPQPSTSQRRQLIDNIRRSLAAAADQHAGDPGHVVMRRLTSAEYSYTIQDLTGLDLNLELDFVSDAVGGEGFTNVGAVQFIQDSTLERYLDAARKVATYAVIGAGPLQFFRDPGKTGFELSAIHRINRIYREHGFRTGAGEGAEPYGLDRYTKAFFAAWRYRHREALSTTDVSLAALAAEENVDARFVQHIWSVLNDQSPLFPVSEIVAKWQTLPVPSGPASEELETQVRTQCDELYAYLHDWQSRLAATAAHGEESAVLIEGSFDASPTHSFRSRVRWPQGAAKKRIDFSVQPADPNSNPEPVVVWRNAKIRFRRNDRRWQEEQPLTAVLSDETTRKFGFGRHPGGQDVAATDFVTAGTVSFSIEFPVADGLWDARFSVDAQLDTKHGEDCVVRCAISDDEEVSQDKTVSAVLADPNGSAFHAWHEGVNHFARLLPEVSHREPAPSDRDPIPAPFDNTYNTTERNFFHYKVKYHRDDRFLVEKILDDPTRERLDQAWADLLTSFEYHDVVLRFVAEKFNLDRRDRGIADIDQAWVDQLPAGPRKYLRPLIEGFLSARTALQAAQSGHVQDAVELASRAWRRPLDEHAETRLQTFYERLRNDEQLTHPQAIRALLARILVSPEFLYRAERPAAAGQTPLSDWELASRVSYFLWSSLPDAHLRQAAASGELSDPQALARVARRMLRDPKARRLATEFFGQWFGFYQFDRYRGVDADRFPEFTDQLKSAMYEEAVAFFEYIVRHDRPVQDILFADYAFLNGKLSQHYGIPTNATSTSGHARVPGVDRFHRGGLMGLGAVLTVTSAPMRTSAVKRGDWMLRRVLGTPVPPPPPDAGSIPADDVLGDGLTVRARLEAHRRDPSCTNCHSRIDPLGFALEHYDAIGRWRNQYRDGQPIDDSGTLKDGIDISGLEGLRSYLADQQEQTNRTLCTKLLGYALGRSELASDRALINEMVAELASDCRFSNLVVKIVTSDQFRFHRGHDASPVVKSSPPSASARSEDHDD